MKSKLRKLLLLLIFSQVVLSAQPVLADTGPKPSMEFTFRQESLEDQLTIVSGILYECEQPDCSDASPLKELGPQRFTCDVSSCSATAYGFAPYHKIEIEFSDEETRESNVFETAGFNSRYTVTVRPDDLLVEAQFSLGVVPPLVVLLVACICALIGLGGLAGLTIFLVRRSKKN